MQNKKKPYRIENANKCSIVFLAFIFLFSCSDDKRKTEVNTNKSDTSIKANPIQPTKTTENKTPDVFSENCVLFLMPNKHELEKLKQDKGIDFDEYVSDLEYYSGIACDKLDSAKIKSYYIDTETIRLKKSDNSILKLEKKNIAGNMIIFNKSKMPKISNSADFKKSVVIDFLTDK